MSSWQIVLLEPARQILEQIGRFVTDALLVIILLILGWLIAKLIKGAVTKGLRALKLDDISDRIELDSLLEKGGISYSLSELMGVGCYWLTLLVTFMVAVNAVGLTVTADLLQKVVGYIPNVVCALFILILGMFVATLLRNIVQAAASNSGVSQGKLLGKVVEGIVIAFAVFVGLEQLKIGLRLTHLTLAIILGSIGLALALAFGLGCKDIAAKYMDDLIDKLKKK
jgi:hypothetical protein